MDRAVTRGVRKVFVQALDEGFHNSLILARFRKVGTGVESGDKT